MDELPTTMNALVQTATYGDPKDVLELRPDHPMPSFDPEGSDLLVKVHATSINPVDYKIIEGFMAALKPTKFPFIPGSDLSGVLVRAGANYKGDLKPGDNVWADNIRNGAIADYSVVPETKCHAMPGNLSFEQAAAIPLAGLTAYQALKFKGGLKPGQKVLVLGGSGGTGTFALQIAKALGAAYVATTSSSEELCKDCGADQVINYKKGEKFGEVLKGQDYDMVFDCVGGVDSWLESRHVLKRCGVFVTIVGDSTDNLTFGRLARNMSILGWRKAKSLFKRPNYVTFLTDSDTKADYDALRGMVEAGKLKPVIDPTSPYSLDKAKDAFAFLQTHRAKGKIVIKMT